MTEANQNKLRRYLRLATWGLWGAKKREVRQELEGNIRETVIEKRLAGLSEDEALTATLTEFGKPELVSVGMSRVYTMPTLIRNALLACAVGGIGVSFLSRSDAQISATRQGVLPVCKTVKMQRKTGELVTVQNITSDCRQDSETTWVSVSSLTKLLESKGVKVKPDLNGLRLTFPGDQPLLVEMRPQQDAHVARSRIRSFERDGETYLSTYNLITSIANGSSLPVRLFGWTNPRVTVGKTSLNFGTPDVPVSSRLLHEDIFFSRFGGEFVRNVPANGLYRFPMFPRFVMLHPYRHRLKMPDPPGTAYAMMARFKEGVEQSTDTADYAPVLEDGTLELAFPWEKVEFVTDFKLISARPVNGRYRAILARFTGRIDPGGRAWQIVLPAQPFSDGVK